MNELIDNLESNKKDLDFLPLIDHLVGNNINNFIENKFCDFILTSIPKLIAHKVIPQNLRISGKIETRLGRLLRDNFRRGRFCHDTR
jgi:hypothetical protein